MTWKPDLDTGNTAAPGGLLKEALAQLGVTPQEPLRDDSGVFAFHLGECVLVAKRSTFGFIVSAHKRAIYAALNRGVPLVMYIANTKSFYEFDPMQLVKESIMNVRLGETMFNFSIKLGKRIFKEWQKEVTS
jgi:hypothetical protein